MDSIMQYNGMSHAGCTNGRHISIQPNTLTRHQDGLNLYHRMIEKENAVRSNAEAESGCRFWKGAKMEMKKAKGWMKKKDSDKEETKAAITIARPSLRSRLARLTFCTSSPVHLRPSKSRFSLASPLTSTMTSRASSLRSSKSATRVVDTNNLLPLLATDREGEEVAPVESVGLEDVKDGNVELDLGDKR